MVKWLSPVYLFFAAQLLLSCQTNGQAQKNYTVHFRSGDFLPKENLSTVIHDSKLLTGSEFNGKYYLVLQFYSLPDSSVKKLLADNHVSLLHYLPQYAYIATIPSSTDLQQLERANVRSLFVPTSQQKLAEELRKNKLPVWAVPSNGLVDVMISLIEPIDLALLTEPIQKLNANVVNQQQQFSTMTVRIPQQNLFKLAQLPFVLWVDVLPEPAIPEKLQRAREQ